MPEATPAIEVRELVKTYAGVTAVNAVSFTVARGEVVGFLGPNGAGKSTTMRILTGCLPATSGDAAVCGHSVAAHTGEVRRLVGYMPENNPLPEDMRVSEYLHYRGRLKEIPRRKLGPRLDEVLEMCDLKRVRHRIIGTLSKGFRQRVGLAECILAEPPVIIMDEPTIGLDPHQILIVRDLIASLRGRMAMIISSHILPEIEVTCDRVLIINQGRVVAQGTPAQLRREVLGGARYELEIAADAAGLAALPKLLTTVEPTLQIIASDLPAEGGFSRLRLATGNPAELGESLLRTLAGDGRLRVRGLNRLHPSLEEVFLAATKRSWDTLDRKTA
jgi:ABC-2 type transport system ATP-binding protein